MVIANIPKLPLLAKTAILKLELIKVFNYLTPPPFLVEKGNLYKIIDRARQDSSDSACVDDFADRAVRRSLAKRISKMSHFVTKLLPTHDLHFLIDM